MDEDPEGSGPGSNQNNNGMSGGGGGGGGDGGEGDDDWDDDWGDEQIIEGVPDLPGAPGGGGAPGAGAGTGGKGGKYSKKGGHPGYKPVDKKGWSIPVNAKPISDKQLVENCIEWHNKYRSKHQNTKPLVHQPSVTN